jgi:hypothetical protein
MIELHDPTLSLIVALVSGVGIVVMTALWRINPQVPGPGVWTVAALFSGLGFLVAV